MGLFDDFAVVGETKFSFTCSAGHEVRKFQSKDWDSMMRHYTILGDRIYEGSSEHDRDVSYEHLGEDVIEHTTARHRLVLVRRFDGVVMYTSCEKCAPVLTRSKSRARAHEHFPWVSLSVKIDGGVIVGVESTKASQTREELREELRNSELDVLADDDPLAVRHMAERGRG